MLVKIHNSYRTVVAVCDTELIGKSFEQNNLTLEVNKHFFEGDEKTPEETQKIIQLAAQEDATFNIVGEQSTDLAIRTGIIKLEGIIKIQDIPVALSLL